jgi:phosphonate degradation associated HDIG domain protein
MQTATLDDLMGLYERRGRLQYAGEPVTQLMHAWQCLLCGQREGASPSILLAAFFHDVGHLLQADDRSPTLAGIDDRHEKVGAALLARVFDKSVSLPVALHVDAKRFLVATDPGYMARLSEDSVRSLKLQGGAMTEAERSLFVANTRHEDAIRLRMWDDEAKEASREAPSFASIKAMLLTCADRLSASGA